MIGCKVWLVTVRVPINSSLARPVSEGSSLRLVGLPSALRKRILALPDRGSNLSRMAPSIPGPGGVGFLTSQSQVNAKPTLFQIGFNLVGWFSRGTDVSGAGERT